MALALLELKKQCETQKSQKKHKGIGQYFFNKKERSKRGSHKETLKENMKRLEAVGVER